MWRVRARRKDSERAVGIGSSAIGIRLQPQGNMNIRNATSRDGTYQYDVLHQNFIGKQEVSHLRREGTETRDR
jgi:hypothetical protein